LDTHHLSKYIQKIRINQGDSPRFVPFVDTLYVKLVLADGAKEKTILDLF